MIKRSGLAGLVICSLHLVSPASAQEVHVKPPHFDACMQEDTPATRSQIYAACMQSVQKSNFSRYVIDAKLSAKIKATTGRTEKMTDEARAERDPHLYYAAIATARQTEILEKMEQAQAANEHSAKLCWHAESASRFARTYQGALRGHDFEARKSRAAALRENCRALPRQTFDASERVPDSGNLMVDIPEYKTCLSPVTSNNIFDIYYACRLADSKNDMLAFRKAGGGVRGPMAGGSSLSNVMIATAKIKFRQAELANVMEPKNMEYMCNLINRVVYNFGQSDRAPAAGSKDAAMFEQAKQMKAGCTQRGF